MTDRFCRDCGCRLAGAEITLCVRCDIEEEQRSQPYGPCGRCRKSIPLSDPRCDYCGCLIHQRIFMTDQGKRLVRYCDQRGKYRKVSRKEIVWLDLHAYWCDECGCLIHGDQSSYCPGCEMDLCPECKEAHDCKGDRCPYCDQLAILNNVDGPYSPVCDECLKHFYFMEGCHG